MSAVTAGVRLAVLALPRALRRRYREEWEADLAGARQLGLAPAAVLVGALGTVLSIDRTDPMVTGVPRSALRRRRGRWSAALLLTAALLAAGSHLRAHHTTPVLGVIMTLAVAACGVAGCWMLIGAFRIPPDAPAKQASRPYGATAPITMRQVNPIATPRLAPLPASTRWAYGVGFALATLAAVAVGLLDITVWSPLARVPGSSLDEIYAAMAAAGEGTGTVGLIGWAVLATCGAIRYLVLCRKAGRIPLLTRRKLLALGLLLLGGMITAGWFAGFPIGMGLGDTFHSDSGTVAPTTLALGLIGLLALSCGTLLNLTERTARP